MDATLIEALANFGIAGVVIILIILGYLVPKPAVARIIAESDRKDAVIAKQQEANDLERQRADVLAQAGGVTNQLIGGLVKLATERRAEQVAADGTGTGSPAGPLNLTGKDLGL